MDENNKKLDRFISAQDIIYEKVKKELGNAYKETHWMWFIFPQIQGLGITAKSNYYAIESVEEAKAYMKNPVLGTRLIECCRILLGLQENRANRIFGYVDSLKLKSSMTLFLYVSNNPDFQEILDKYFNGEKDYKTLEIIFNQTKEKSKIILGAIAGDIIGSCYESLRNSIKTTDFKLFSDISRFTDDSVLTVATMDCLMSQDRDHNIYYQRYGRNYPNAGFSRSFSNWIFLKDPQPYNSAGNGSAMRVSPVGWFFNTMEETLTEARRSAEVSHNHPEGVKGAQSVAAAVFLARNGESKNEIRQYIEKSFGYDLQRKISKIRKSYKFSAESKYSVPESIIAFLDSTDFESAIRLAVSLGGDADTQAAIAGSIAEAYYGGTPIHIAEQSIYRLPADFQEIISRFSRIVVK